MESFSTDSTSELAARAAAGDEIAVTVLLSLAYPRLRHHLQRRIPSDIQAFVDVDDLVQDAQIRVFRHIGTFQDTGEDSFYRWLATIALHRLRNVIKAQRALKRGQGRVLNGPAKSTDSGWSLLDWVASPENTPSRNASGKEARQAMQDSLAALPEHYREAVRLVYLEGRSVQEAAQIMGRTERAIHNLCYKAKLQMHLIMGSTSRFFSRP